MTANPYFFVMAYEESTEPMICAQCRFPLSRMTYEGIPGYIHTSDINVDHVPQPTPERESTTSMASCDFCNEPMPYHGAWVVTTKKIVQPGPQGFTIELSPDWGACEPCAAFIREGQWHKLTERSVNCMLARHPEFRRKAIQRDMEFLHGQVRNGFISIEWDPS